MARSSLIGLGVLMVTVVLAGCSSSPSACRSSDPGVCGARGDTAVGDSGELMCRLGAGDELGREIYRWYLASLRTEDCYVMASGE